jgi:hypothetical protein
MLLAVPSAASADTGTATIQPLAGSTQVLASFEVTHECVEPECVWYAYATAHPAAVGCPPADQTNFFCVQRGPVITGSGTVRESEQEDLGPGSVICIYVNDAARVLVGQVPYLSPPPSSSAPSSLSLPAQSSTLSIGEARGDVKTVIRRKTGHKAHNLRMRCTQEGAANVTCTATWIGRIPPTRYTYIYSGSFPIEARNGSDYWTFEGQRAQWGCTRHHSVRHCAHSVQW